MTERIGSPDKVPDPRDGAAAQGRGKPEGRTAQDAPASLRPDANHALKSANARQADNDQAGGNSKPSLPERFTAAVKNVVVPAAATVIIGATSFAPLPHAHHDLADDGRDRSELTAKADRETVAVKNAGAAPVSADQDIRPSAADRYVAEASAQVTAAEDDGSPGERLKKWIDEDGDEFLRAVAEDQEQRKEESETRNTHDSGILLDND
jgi:hypothetical protein